MVVTVLNNSSSVWNEKTHAVKCCLLINNLDIGLRAYIPEGQDVNPGETITFSFENVAGTIENADTAVIQMLQEGITYFGEAETVKSPFSCELLDAEIISSTCPTEAAYTDTYDIDITVKNTGKIPWTANDDINLCIWQDNLDYGFRVNIADNVIIKPGDEYTFTLKGFIFPEQQSTELAFQMLQEGVTYFGEKEAQKTQIKQF